MILFLLLLILATSWVRLTALVRLGTRPSLYGNRTDGNVYRLRFYWGIRNVTLRS